MSSITDNVEVIKEKKKKNLFPAINKEKLYSKSVLYAQLFLFALILIFFPLEFPSLQLALSLNCNQVFNGIWANFFQTSTWIFPSDIIIILIGIFSLHKWKKYLFSAGCISLVLFIITIITSTIISKNHSNYPSVSLFHLVILTFLFPITHYILSTDIKTKINFIFWCLLALLLFHGTISIIEYFTQSLVGLKRFETTSIFESVFPVPSKQLWLFDSLFSITRNSETIGRSPGTIGHANILGGLLFFCSFVPIYFFYMANKRWKELLCGAVIFFSFFSLITTFSRATILSYIICSGLFFLFFLHPSMKAYRDRKKLIKLSLTLIFTILICFGLFFVQLWNRGGVINYNAFTYNASDLPRIIATDVALKIIEFHPFLGVGINNIITHIPTAAFAANHGGVFICVVHNIYLLIAVEGGLIALGFFLMFILNILKGVLKNLTPVKITLLVTFIGFLIIACLDRYFWTAHSGRIMFFLCASLLNGVLIFDGLSKKPVE